MRAAWDTKGRFGPFAYCSKITARRSSSAPPSPLRLLLPPASRRRRHHFRPQGTPSTLGLERIYSVHASRPSPARPAWRPRSGASGGHTSSPPLSVVGSRIARSLSPPLLRLSAALPPSSVLPRPCRASRPPGPLPRSASDHATRHCCALLPLPLYAGSAVPSAARPPARPPARPGSSVLRVR